MALIWVKATQTGFDGMQRHREGHKFQVDEKAFSEKWMKKIKTPIERDEDELDADLGPKGKPKGKAVPRASDESKI